MRAGVRDRYGSADVLRLDEVEKPVAGEGEVLVRVRAAGVDRGVWHLMTGLPYLGRLAFGLRAPRNPVLGVDVAGVAESVGNGVSTVRPGDEIFGSADGSFAEYAAVREDRCAPKPAGTTFEQAAAIPDGSLLALTMLRQVSPLEGKDVLVYGAAGSIGSAAVQLLVHHFGAHVTAVCDTKDVDVVRELGARDVLDRLREDFTRNGETYDVVFDAVGKHSFRRSRRSLKAGGTYITAGLGFMYHVPFVALGTRFARSRRAKLGIGRYRREDLLSVKALVEAGKYRPVIDRTYSIDDAVEANRYVQTGQKTGNVVLRVGS